VWSFTTRQAPPATPVLSTPSSNSTGVSLSPVLVWQSAVNATSYRVQLSTSSSFNTLTVDETTTQTSRSLSNLSYSTTYYWRVKSYNAIDSSDWSAVWSFTTRLAPPAAPVLISPSNGATALDTFTTLVWQSVANAIGYRVQLSTSSTFNTLIINEATTQTSRSLSNLSYSTMYYWRVKSYTLSDSSDWATATFTTLSRSLPANWSFNSNTGNFAVIGLNPNGTYRIGDRYISNGDAIGVFYLDSIYEKCAGYMIWNGQNYGIVVWGDDDFTQNIKEGYSLGETYIIKVWNAQTLTEHYSDYRIQSGPNAYQPNGITIIDSIGAIVKITHTIPLNNGWNMISSYVLPDSSNISYLLAPLNQNLQIMRNMFGLVYSPQVVNTLNQWSRFHSYQIRVAGQTSLPIYGVRLYPQALPLFLTTNWYWMPYPRTSSMQLTTAMSSVLNKILQVKTITGQVYHPPFFNTLQTLEPGKGYMIKMTQGARFVFPPNSAIKSSALSNSFAEPSVFVRENHISGKTAVLPMEIADIQDGDEVGVFTRDGLLVGSSVWQEGLRGVVVWGDDEFTPEKDGAYEGEELVVKVWSQKNNTIGSVRIAETRNYSDGESTQTLKYETDAILLLKGAVEYKTTSLAITPQPASEELFITYSNFSGEAVEIEIFNQNGSLMLHKSQNPTGGAVKLDISRLPNGVYFVTLRNGAFFAKERFVIVR
ncbi:MAG: T9SS type A sorting domain-containing protein, partial [Ignavibacteria bacterium]|nr:T9SS type A sorting domain-containing protein [Ignavibacteria bacterium]